jgi:pyruvate/2-oxoglutarate dehydrogenase complex dihydrolipoamide acyltransferase (E2) component
MMAIPVLMPALEPGMTEGTIVRWEKKIGDPVRKGEILLRVETDTAETDLEAASAGVLLKIEAEADQIVPCGETIAWLGEKGEKI